MGIQEFPQVDANATLAQLREILAETNQLLDFVINGKLDSRNIREIAGYIVGLTEFMHKSGLVGLSGADPLNPDAIRFWAGLADKTSAPYRVNQAGELTAMAAYIMGTIEALSGHIGGFTIEADKLSSDSGDGVIEGGTIVGALIKTAYTGARIELSSGVLEGYSEDDNLHGLVFSPTPTSNFFDLFFYHDGAKILEFIDNAVSVTMQGAADSIGMILGGIDKPTFGAGTWKFTGYVTFNEIINGKASNAIYADSAGTAAAADSLAPSGNIPWGQVTKTGSNVSDLAVRNLSSLTDDSTHRTVTDTEKTTWNAKRSGSAALNTCIQVSQSAGQAFTGGAFAKLNLATEAKDNLNEWDVTASRFTPAANDRTYILNAGVYFLSAADGNEIGLAVYVNGSLKRLIANHKVGGSGNLGAYGSAILDSLTTSDYVEVWAYTANTLTTNPSSNYTYASITRSS